MNSIQIRGHAWTGERFAGVIQMDVGDFFNSILENIFVFWRKNWSKTAVYRRDEIPTKFKDINDLSEKYDDFLGKFTGDVSGIVLDFHRGNDYLEIECALTYGVRFEDLGLVTHLRKFDLMLSNDEMQSYDFTIQDPTGLGDWKYLGVQGLDVITFRDSELESIGSVGSVGVGVLDVFG